MGYALGIDLGTTYTAAATFRDGRVEIANLGNRAAAVPSWVRHQACATRWPAGQNLSTGMINVVPPAPMSSRRNQ